jgi:hypothetical protein
MKLVFCLAALLATAAAAQAQPAPQRIVGNRATSNWKMDSSSRVITDTMTLVFQSADGGPVYTIDFVTRHPLKEAVPAPGVVDMVVTQLPVEDETPQITLRVDGETVPIVTRLRGRRSVVASLPLAEFDRIAQAGNIVDRTFNTELEFGAGQVGLLRRMADAWIGRIR